MKKYSASELLDFANKGLNREEIMEKIQVSQITSFYGYVKKKLSEETYVSFLKKVKANSRQRKTTNSSQKKATATTPMPFTICELNQFVKDGKTKEDIMDQYQVFNRQVFTCILTRLCKISDVPYSLILDALMKNRISKCLEMSKSYSLEEIAKDCRVTRKSFYTIMKKHFNNIEDYKKFMKEINYNIKAQSVARRKKKEKVEIVQPLQALPLNTIKKLDIYHKSYLKKSSCEVFAKELADGNYKLIPNYMIKNMLNTKSELLEVIAEAKNINSSLFIEESFNSFYLVEVNSDHDYYTKLALYYMRKGYQVTLFCNDITILIDCLLLGIHAVHNVKYYYNAREIPSYDSAYCYAYDTSYLKHNMVDLSTPQQKIICECVLEEIKVIGANNIFYHIMDMYYKPNTNVHILPTFSGYSRYNRYSENDNTILDYLQRYELDTGKKVKIYTDDSTFYWEALSLGFSTNSLLDKKTTKAEEVKKQEKEEKDTVLVSNDYSEKQIIPRTITIPIVQQNKKHYVLVESVKAVTVDKKAKIVSPIVSLKNQKYYKLFKGNFVMLDNNKQYIMINLANNHNAKEVI